MAVACFVSRLLSRVIPFLLLMATMVHAQPVIKGYGELAPEALDKHGDTIGGIGSGAIYDPKTNKFLCLSDRGPGDGTLPYRPRYVTVKVKTNPENTENLILQVTDSVIFCDEHGREMTGLIPDDPTSDLPRMKDGRTCLDPEAIAIAPDGTLYVSDEYGPFIYQFRRDGRMIRRIRFPEIFTPRAADGRVQYGVSVKLAYGREINRGPEGICILPDGKTLAAIFQNGLVEDGARKSMLMPLILLDLKSGKPKSLYCYQFDTAQAERTKNQLSVNDIAALDEHRFLVLERDKDGRDGSKKSKPAVYKSVWLINTSEATDMLSRTTPRALIPVKKYLLFNLPELVPDPGMLAAKWEGIAIIPPIADNKITLMMTADNDFLTPVIHENGGTHDFPRVKKPVPTQFYKIIVPLPKE